VGGSLGLALLGAFMVSRFAAGFEAGLPAAARSVLPPEQVATLSHNPNAMVSEQGQQQLRSSFSSLGAQSGAVADETLGVMRSALADAIADVFIVATGVIAAALVATLFLKEVPLARRAGQGGAPGHAGAGGASRDGHAGTGAAAGPPAPPG
jgi:hypothetical protein